MQKVFENVIEMLEEEKNDLTDWAEDIAFGLGIRRSIEIIKQAAAEYNNGWIPCNERMPEERESMFAKLKGTEKWKDNMFEKISDEVNVTIEKEDGKRLTMHAHTVDGKWKNDMLRVYDTWRVIAWKPLPISYQSSEIIRKKTNFDRCCESMEAMAQIIDIAKIGWTKEQIMEWLQKEECEVPE